MSTLDLSRESTDFQKHYAGVRMQQGRVLTDDDFNEAAILDAEDMRRTKLDALGAFGSPDDGFLPYVMQLSQDRIRFLLNKGTLYLGGLRLDLAADEAFEFQKDWLTFDTARDWPIAPGSQDHRVDLVWIEAWQQPVTATEDRELFEPALGGPDTSGRMRTMRRVHVIPDIGYYYCELAWERACQIWASEGAIGDDMELASSAKLTVSYTAPPTSENLCNPATSGDYLGAENQAIRVQAIDATHFTWGFDNAAPLYRARVTQASATSLSVQLLSFPKDALHWPLVDQVVELLPCGAELSNGEKLAEGAGHLTKVTGIEPDTQSFTVPSAAAAPRGDLVFVRVWNRGEDLSSPAAIPLTTGTLGHTGLAVAFKGGAPRPGDYWIIAARPSTPDVITPWSLQAAAGAPPRGIKRYRAPLGLIRWSPGRAEVIDCRPLIRPLASLRCCEELVAKPGPGWHLIFNRIAAGQDASICFPPGNYPMSGVVNIVGKGRLRLRGAGAASRLKAFGNEAVLRFTECDGVDISDLYVFGGNLVQAGLGGAITIQNVPQVSLRKVFARCKGDRNRERACVRIESDSPDKASRVSVIDCAFYVGHLQVGLLLLNVKQAQVRGNRFVPSGPEVEKLQTLLKDETFCTNLAQSSLVWIRNAEQEVPEDQKVRILHDGKEPVLFTADEALARLWRSYIDEEGRTYAPDQGGYMRIHYMRKLQRFLGGSWQNLMKSRFSPWINAIAQHNRAVIGQAIVAGGVQAESLVIESNEIEGAVQGVHVGLSHQTDQRNLATADIVRRVVIRQNHVHSVLCAGAPQERHGIFVGNAQSATIAENFLTLERLPGVRHLPMEGIRVFGHLGEMVLITGNHLQGFSTPISRVARGSEPSDAQRVVRDNYPPENR
jgi:hypothetical protein